MPNGLNSVAVIGTAKGDSPDGRFSSFISCDGAKGCFMA